MTAPFSPPEMMTAIVVSRPGGPDVLIPQTVPTPRPRPGEILVRVEAAGVNRPDAMQRAGKYPPPPDADPTLGLEVAGTVVARGEGVDSIALGERVCGLTHGGGYAQYCRLPVGQTLPWPVGFDAVTAAAIPETFFTVWANLFTSEGLPGRPLQPGQTVLVQGGAGGIGTTALMLLRTFGLSAIATAGTEAKCDLVRQLGAVAVNYRTEDFVTVVGEVTGGRGVDAVLDIVGGEALARHLACLAPGGRLILLAFQNGAVADRVDLRPILFKRLIVTGSTLRPRSIEEKARIASELRKSVWPRFDLGELRPLVTATFPLVRAADAHRRLESGDHVGKIVLTVGGADGSS